MEVSRIVNLCECGLATGITAWPLNAKNVLYPYAGNKRFMYGTTAYHADNFVSFYTWTFY